MQFTVDSNNACASSDQSVTGKATIILLLHSINLVKDQNKDRNSHKTLKCLHLAGRVVGGLQDEVICDIDGLHQARQSTHEKK